MTKMANDKGKKCGRGKDRCKAYRESKRTKINKMRRLARRVKKFPNDSYAKERLAHWRNQ